MPFEEWTHHGRRLGAIARGAKWWVGDWLRYGNLRYGERYTRAARLTGYDVQTLMNMVYVASRFDAAGERRANLSWSHHAEVAGVPRPDRDLLLDHAERERMSVRCLREELRRRRRQLGQAEPDDRKLRRSSHQAVSVDADVCPHCGHPL